MILAGLLALASNSQKHEKGQAGIRKADARKLTKVLKQTP